MDLSRLPVISAVVREVLELTASPDVAPMAVAQAIEGDPVVCARLLRVANSPYFGAARAIGSVRHAVTFLGLEMVRALVVSAAVMEALRPTRPLAGIPLDAFWEHSSAVAVLARRVATSEAPALSGEAFVAGLLHDIGSLILACSSPDRYRQVLETGARKQWPIVAVEPDAFGMNHAHVGGAAARHWGLPHALVNAIQHHHSPGQALRYGELASVVHVADAAAQSMGIAGFETAPGPWVEPCAWLILGGRRLGAEADRLSRYTGSQTDQQAIRGLSAALAAG
ncbi:MAG TPA: HDOD domain-containing protein [Armatimonadota bacterium]|nr:HDOD domain-containing protein [Armatimonadota bacterium]HQK94564.1 HDOD domain-containing protein [Armatimonadota bacterium]